jgi:hypothetical protein
LTLFSNPAAIGYATGSGRRLNSLSKIFSVRSEE